MLQRFLCLIIIAFVSVPMYAQFTGIDASQFPTIKAYGGGTIFNNAKTSDFSVVENGQAIFAGLSVQCSTAINDPSVNIVLVLDISESMNETMSNGRTKLEWVKNGARNFVNSMIFNGTTQCAIVTFNGNSYIHCGFQNNATAVITAIDAISYGIGSTNYNNPLIDPKNSAIALFKTTPPWIRRVIVFLTDGTPTQATQTTSIVNQLNGLTITLYAIALSFDASPDLRAIALQTGGTTSVAYNEDMLVNIYKELGNKRPNVTYCWLTYIAPFGCDDKSLDRTVQLTFKPTNLRQTFSYTAPANSISSIQNSAVSLPPFPDIAPGQTANQQYTITAKNTDITVIGFSSSLPANFTLINWGGSAPPFVLKKDQSRTITAQFTQTSPRDVRSGLIRINGIPCSSPPLYVSGGLRKVIVSSPNGSEVFSSCDSVLITWGGIEAIDTVRLHYSSNSGANWHVITNKAMGLQYKWKSPSQGNYLIRVSAYTIRNGSVYNATAGGIGIESFGGIGVSADASSFGFTGTYDKQLTLNGATVNSTRTKDMFIAKCKDQTLGWLKTSSVFYPKYLPYTLCLGKAITVDSADNLFHVSEIVRTVNSGRQSLVLSRISPSGGVDWSKEILGTQQSLQAHNLGKDSLGNYYLTGTYDGQLSVKLTVGNTSSIVTIAPKLFTLVFDANGNFLLLKDSISSAYPKISADTTRDTLGYMYTIRSYKNTLTLSDTSFKSIGLDDLAVRVTGRIMTPFDESDSPFTVTTPLLTTAYSTINFTGLTKVLVGDKKDSLLNTFLCNRSKTTVILDTTFIEGNDSSDFQVLQPDIGTVIQPDSCIPVFIRFAPKTSGNKRATLVFGNGCVHVKASIEAESYAMSASLSDINWNPTRKNTQKSLNSLFRNDGEIPLTIHQISIVNGTQYTLDNPNTLPIIILPGDSLNIAVRFTPSDTMYYSDSLQVLCTELTSPLYAQLTGNGIIPVFASKGYTFMPVNTGVKSNESGLIHTLNLSGTMPMYIKSARLSQNAGDFSIDSLTSLPSSFNQLDTHLTTIGFKPLKSGNRTAYLVFDHDAAPGPEAYPLISDSVLIQGIGISSMLNPDTLIDFGTINSCDKAVKSLSINNPNNQDIRIITMKWSYTSPTNATHFFAQVNLPFIVPSNGSTRFPIQFAPDAKQSYEAELLLIGEDSTQYTIKIIGKAETIPSTVIIKAGTSAVANQSISVKPGDIATCTMSAQITRDLSLPLLSECTLFITFDPSIFSIQDSVQSLHQNWQWIFSTINNQNGNAIIQGKAINPSVNFPINSLVSFTLDSYLNIDRKQPLTIALSTNSPCVDSGFGAINTELLPVCFNPGRAIGNNGIPLSIQINKKHGSGYIVNFSIPFDALSDAIVVDIHGKLYPLLQKEYRNAGNYEVIMPHLPYGFYTVLLRNGFYQQAECFINE